MKKLTAGIFATLLAVVSVGAAHAEIASKGYVDQQVGTKADAATVSTLQGTVSEHATQIAGKADKATTLEGYGITDGATKTELTEGLEGKLDTGGTAAKATADASGNVITTTYATKTELTEGLGAKANTADLGALATLDAVGSTQITDGAVATADIADKAVTEAKLSDTVNASLDKADTALQAPDLAGYVTKTAADAAYADIATEGVASTASTKADTALTNIGTLTNLTTDAKTNTVAAINEVATEAAAAATAASAADTKAGQAQTAATAAQGDVDALEAVVTNETTGLAAAHTAIDALETGKLDKNGTAASATADASGNVITDTYATKAEIADMATDENLALKQDKTDNTLQTTNKTVVGAINEVRTTANAAIPKVNVEGSDGKYVLTATAANGVATYKWELIERGSAE